MKLIDWAANELRPKRLDFREGINQPAPTFLPQMLNHSPLRLAPAGKGEFESVCAGPGQRDDAYAAVVTSGVPSRPHLEPVS